MHREGLCGVIPWNARDWPDYSFGTAVINAVLRTRPRNTNATMSAGPPRASVGVESDYDMVSHTWPQFVPFGEIVATTPTTASPDSAANTLVHLLASDYFDTRGGVSPPEPHPKQAHGYFAEFEISPVVWRTMLPDVMPDRKPLRLRAVTPLGAGTYGRVVQGRLQVPAASGKEPARELKVAIKFQVVERHAYPPPPPQNNTTIPPAVTPRVPTCTAEIVTAAVIQDAMLAGELQHSIAPLAITYLSHEDTELVHQHLGLSRKQRVYRWVLVMELATNLPDWRSLLPTVMASEFDLLVRHLATGALQLSALKGTVSLSHLPGDIWITFAGIVNVDIRDSNIMRLAFGNDVLLFQRRRGARTSSGSTIAPDPDFAVCQRRASSRDASYYIMLDYGLAAIQRVASSPLAEARLSPDLRALHGAIVSTVANPYATLIQYALPGTADPSQWTVPVRTGVHAETNLWSAGTMACSVLARYFALGPGQSAKGATIMMMSPFDGKPVQIQYPRASLLDITPMMACVALLRATPDEQDTLHRPPWIARLRDPTRCPPLDLAAFVLAAAATRTPAGAFLGADAIQRIEGAARAALLPAAPGTDAGAEDVAGWAERTDDYLWQGWARQGNQFEKTMPLVCALLNKDAVTRVAQTITALKEPDVDLDNSDGHMAGPARSRSEPAVTAPHETNLGPRHIKSVPSLGIPAVQAGSPSPPTTHMILFPGKRLVCGATGCKASAEYQCGACRMCMYCSAVCQRVMWSEHSLECQGPFSG